MCIACVSYPVFPCFCKYCSFCTFTGILYDFVYRQNHITQLPQNLEAMLNIQVLSLSSNLLEELPEAVASLLK